MTYIPALEKIQVGEEAAYGDGAAATIQLAGKMMKIDPKVEAEQIVDKRGTTMPAHIAIVKKRWVEGSIDGMLDYTTARLWLNSMFGTDATSPHTYLASLDWAPETPASLAMYYGQTGLIYKASGCIISQLDINGESGSPVNMSAKFFGQPVASGGSFASLGDPNPPFVLGTQATVYLDPIASACGTTLLTSLGFKFAASITCNRKPIWHLGSQVPDATRPGRWGGSMKLTIEATTAMLAYLTSILAETSAPLGLTSRVRMTNATQIFDLDFAGQIITPPSLIPEEDGITTVEFDMLPVYSSQAAFLSCWAASLTLP